MTDGPIWFTRKNTPIEHRNTATWAQVEPTALELEQRPEFERRQRALTAYLNGQPVDAIWHECQIRRHELIRYLNRCLCVHADGRIYGWRALLPSLHIEPYTRTAPESGSFAGLFTHFLRTHPQIQQALDRIVLDGKDPHALPHSRLSRRTIHTKFKRLCIEAGVLSNQYPLNTEDQGRRSIARYVRTLLHTHFSRGARRLGGPDAQTRARTGTGHAQHVLSSAPFDVCSIDAHRLNFIGVVSIPTATGINYIPIHRMLYIPVIEHETTAVLGYHVCISREASALDAVRAVRNALSIWSPRSLKLPGHIYPPGAMLPSRAIPAATGLCWNSLLLDNASIHYSDAVAERIRARVGCAVNWGPVGQWYRRALVESLFSALERRGFLQLPNSTGTTPSDPLRADAIQAAIKHAMDWEEMLDLIDVVTCAYMATPRKTLGDRSPLECVNEALLRSDTTWLPRRLPPLPPGKADLDVEVQMKPIRGNLAEGRRPYVTVESVRYTSQILACAADLIGQELAIHINMDDLRTVKAFFPNGGELGVLTAARQWARTRHDRALRREALRAIRKRELVVQPDQDVSEEFLVLKARQAHEAQHRRGSRRPKISRDATTLARASRAAERPIPQVPSTPVREFPNAYTPPAAGGAWDSRPGSSIVPGIQHRGIVK